MDGKKQRNALTAAERAVRALDSGDTATASSAAAKAADLDQLGIYANLPAAVEAGIGELEAGDRVSHTTWDEISQVVGPGPLQELVVRARRG